MKWNGTSLAAVSLALAATFVPGTAIASEVPATVSTTTSDDDILWVETAVETSDVDKLHVKLFAPKANGKGRKLFQVCKFNFSGLGTYRCGVDVAAGSIATDHAGEWVTKVVIDGKVAMKKSFTV